MWAKSCSATHDYPHTSFDIMSGPLRCWWVAEVKLWLSLIRKSVLAERYIYNAEMYCSGRPDLRMRIRRLKMYLISASSTGVYHGVRLVLV
jgi:hypothetical protein